MTAQISKALGLPAIFDLIEAPGEFLPAVKKQELRRQGLKFTEVKGRYASLEGLLELLRVSPEQRRALRELLAELPQPALPTAGSHQSLAQHELFLLKEFLYHYGKLLGFLRRQGWMDQFLLPDLSQIFALLDPERSGLPAFRISAAYSEKLGDILAQRLELGNKLQQARAQLLQEARGELQIPELMEEFTMSRTKVELAERIMHSPFFTLRSESVANYSFLLADDEPCLELKKRLSLLAQQQEKEEERVLKDLSRQILAALPALRSALHTLEQSAWLFLLADFALNHDCCVPQLTRRKAIRIQTAVNLPLKLHLEALGRRYQSVDYDFDQPVSLLTGPNMGGKSTILQTLGQLCWLARLGIPLPCRKAELPLFDDVWTNQADATASPDLSSFGREVVSFTEAIQQEGNTLFLLDEFARGTNPAEGELLASAVLRHLASTGRVCIAATHFTAPALLDGLAHYSIKGLDTAAPALASRLPLSPTQRLKVLSEAMDYTLERLTKNQAPPLSAIRVARILGLPEGILHYTEQKDT